MNSNGKIVAMILLLAGIAGGYWYYHNVYLSRATEPGPAPAVPESGAPPARIGPLHPLPPEQAESTGRKLVPLPALDDSDAYFLLALIDTFGIDIENMLVKEGLVDKFVATIDNLTRSHVAGKIRPVGTLPGTFIADATDDDEAHYLSPENFARYDVIVNIISRADLDAIVATYRRFYPLFQESYERLGYPDAYFNDRVVEVIDHLLATPEPAAPVRLLRPHVLYELADPDLESLSSGQKLLLRMGSAHAASIKGVLRGLRERVAAEPRG